MISRADILAATRAAIAACDPVRHVQRALASVPLVGREVIGVAIGKAAIAMARGAGPVARGLAVTTEGTPALLHGSWRLAIAAHPAPDERSVRAGGDVVALVASAAPDDLVLVLISGGASALVEQPRIPLDEFRAIVGAVMAAGVAIDELNAVRGALSSIKAGGLALASRAPIVTLAVSDVIGDDLAVIGSGPTIGPWLATPGVEVVVDHDARRERARQILARLGIAIPAVLAVPVGETRVTRTDRATVVAPMASFADAMSAALGLRRLDPPINGEVGEVAARLATEPGAFVAWGEPTLVVPADHGEGGRAQQLALALAQRLRGTQRSALVLGSDGIDGPAPRDRPAPAGAFVDGTTWDAIAAMGGDAPRALERRDAGSVLAAIGALVVTGPTGLNHGDIVVVG